MSKEIITNIIEDLESKNLITLPTSKCTKINKEKLIECWSKIKSEQDYEFYGYIARSGSNTAYRKIFSKLNKNNAVPWKKYILSLYKFKYCYSCESILTLNDFNTNLSKKDKKESDCKNCSNLRSKIYRAENTEKERIRSSNYYLLNKKTANARSASRRAAKLNRTPKWVNNSKLREIYKNCPKGYHVDHIIPLQGKLVSGLHVPENLQYLTVKNNLAKSNKYEV